MSLPRTIGGNSLLGSYSDVRKSLKRDFLSGIKSRITKAIQITRDEDFAEISLSFVEFVAGIASDLSPGNFQVGVGVLKVKLDQIANCKGSAGILAKQLREIVELAENIMDVLNSDQTSNLDSSSNSDSNKETAYMTERAKRFLEDTQNEMKLVESVLEIGQARLFFRLRSTQNQLKSCELSMSRLQFKFLIELQTGGYVMQRRLVEMVEKKLQELSKEDNPQTVVDKLENSKELLTIGATDTGTTKKITEFVSEKLNDMHSHADPKLIERFLLCIEVILPPNDTRIFSRKELQLSGETRKSNEYGPSNTWIRQGTLRYFESGSNASGPTSIMVAVKSPSNYLNEEIETIQRRFTREAWILCRLNHPNVVPYYGIYRGNDKEEVRFGLVSKWQESNLKLYIKDYLTANRFKLLYEASLGLQYLHQHSVHHGYLKCSNIFVDQNGTAAIGDFSKANIAGFDNTEARLCFNLSEPSEPPSEDWKAPERFDRPNHITVPPNVSSDVYSFSMAILECLTLKKPFHGKASDQTSLEKVLFPKSGNANLSDKRPNRPKPEDNRWIDDSLWEFLMQCWDDEPENRPLTGEVVEFLFKKAQQYEE